MLKLVYGCLAFSLIAGTFIFVSAAADGPGFRGMTKSMSDAIVQNAAVLAADENGAITQTGNGKIAGYTRDLKKEWSTKFNPFEEGPNNPYGAGTIKSFAWCTEGCPNAILDIDREFTAHGSAGEGLAASLTSMGLTDKSVLSVYARNGAFVSTLPELKGSDTQLLDVVHKTSTALPITNPLTAAADRPGTPRHAIVGSARGRTGFLNRLSLGEKWEIRPPRIREVDLRNACISEDGGSIGLVTNHLKRSEFPESPGRAIGPEITGGTCTVDSDGITAVYTPASNPGSLEAARYTVAGRRIWHHELGTQRLLSKSGWHVLVSQTQSGVVTAIDAVTGRKVFQQQVSGRPFAAQDGSLVTAGRDGKPRWLLVLGKPPSS